MNLSDDVKKFLTEKVLHECWHEHGSQPLDRCIHCDKLSYQITNRTFTTHSDLVALYKAVYDDGKWKMFEENLHERAPYNLFHQSGDFTSYMMCLSTPEEIPDRCMMVAEFYGHKEETK